MISYSGFSNTNANGKTLYTLLSAFERNEMIQFYRGNEKIDFSFAHSYFHVTDKEMLSSFLFKHPVGEYTHNGDDVVKEEKSTGASTNQELGHGIRKHHYNFWLRSLRELLWCIAPFGRRGLKKWIEREAPEAIVYMVGESYFDDKLVLETAEKLNVPLILYNCEAYRTIDLKTRNGIEKQFYRVSEKKYAELHKKADLVIYNCPYLERQYVGMYGNPKSSTIAFNSAPFETIPYDINPGLRPIISYFGNLGVGRVRSILDIADVLKDKYPDIKINIYGKPHPEDMPILEAHPSVILHGFVTPQKLVQVKNESDILLQVESFDPEIVPKLKHAFSTKVAQYLCAGRAILSYAPRDMAATEYLAIEKCAVIASDKDEMEKGIVDLIENAELRAMYAESAINTAKKNHDTKAVAGRIKMDVTDLCR